MPWFNLQVQEASLLFVDSPVGVGYSYVDTDDVRPKTDDAMVQDLVTFFTHFLEKYPGFKVSKFYSHGAPWVMHLEGINQSHKSHSAPLPTMHQKRNVHISVLNCVLWDLGQVPLVWSWSVGLFMRAGGLPHTNPSRCIIRQAKLVFLLTHWGRVTHICVGNLCQHWFR